MQSPKYTTKTRQAWYATHNVNEANEQKKKYCNFTFHRGLLLSLFIVALLSDRPSPTIHLCNTIFAYYTVSSHNIQPQHALARAQEIEEKRQNQKRVLCAQWPVRSGILNPNGCVCVCGSSVAGGAI